MILQAVFLYRNIFLKHCLLKITIEESLETCSMTCLILSHLMNRIMNSIKVQLFSNLCNLHLSSASAFLCKHTLLYVGLCIPYYLTEHLCET